MLQRVAVDFLLAMYVHLLAFQSPLPMPVRLLPGKVTLVVALRHENCVCASQGAGRWHSERVPGQEIQNGFGTVSPAHRKRCLPRLAHASFALPMSACHVIVSRRPGRHENHEPHGAIPRPPRLLQRLLHQGQAYMGSLSHTHTHSHHATHARTHTRNTHSGWRRWTRRTCGT